MGKSGIKIRKVKELKFHPLNDEMYYLSDLQDLRLNIKENGLLVPLVVDQQNQVISGNRRLKCLIDLGIKEVQVLEFDIKEEDDVKFLIYSYNKQRRKRTGEMEVERAC